VIRVTSKGFHTISRQGSAAHHYVLAGQPVVFESEVASLKAYHAGPASERFSEMLVHFNEPTILNAGNATLVYHGQAPFDGQSRRVRYWRQGRRGQVDLDARPVCQIDFKESHVHLIDESSFDQQVNLEVITGPAFVLLLAELGTYCLHAGAIATAVGNIGVIAESGAGKSTLSQHIDRQWKQISDDVLPINLFGDTTAKPKIYADFPQLKLKNCSVKEPLDNDVSLDFLLRINPRPASTIGFKRVDKPASMLQVIRHTVAAKLFDKKLMKHHSNFAKQVSKQVPMLELSYPRQKTQLPKLRAEILTAFTELH